LIAAAAIGAILAGCGGSSSADAGGQSTGGEHTYSVESDTTLNTTSIAKAQFIPRVNKVCRKGWPPIHKNFTEYSGWHKADPGSKEKHFVEAVKLSLLAGIDFHLFDRIHRLGAPLSEKSEVEAVIGALQSGVERGLKGLAPVGSRAQIAALFGEYNQRARQFGFDDCLVDMAHLRGIEV
jgi:hypothetical protein